MGKNRKKYEETTTARKLLYLASHIACGIFIIILFLTLVQCTIKKPEAPSWRTNLTVPLANKTWVMPELIEKLGQENLYTDSSGNPFFLFQSILDTVTISSSFSVPDFNQSAAESLGVIDLDPIGDVNFVLALSDQFPTLPPGLFPDTSFDFSQPLPPLGDYTTATVASGFAVVTIQNDFGLNLDTVIITINDDFYSNQISSNSVPGGVPIGGVYVDTVDLSGQTVSNQLSADIHCHAQQQTSFSLSGKSLTTSVGMPAGISVSSATAKIPALSRDFAESFSITSDHQLQAAAIATGQLVLTIANNTNLSGNLSITIPDFKNYGNGLVINSGIAAGSNGTFSYPLDGYTLEPSDQVMPQDLNIDFDAQINATDPSYVDVSAGDYITVTASVENLTFGSVQGIIGATSADFDNIQEDIDVPTGFDAIQLPSAVLTIEIQNAVNVPGSFDVTVNGNGGQQKMLNGFINPGTIANPVTTVITDSNLAAFMNPIPSQITVSGNATFGDGITSGSITPDDYVIATVTISSPLELAFDSTTFDGEFASTEIDQTDINKITDNLKLAVIHANITNHLPVGVSAQILLGGDSATLYSNPQLILGPIDVASGTVGLDGTVTDAIESATVLSLDSTQVDILQNDPLWIGELITLQSTGGQTVKLTGTDYLSISAYIETEFNVSESLWEDN